MGKPSNTAAFGLTHLFFEPAELCFLFREIGAENHRIESEQAPVFNIFDPMISAKIAVPPIQPVYISRLMLILWFANVVVARGYEQRGCKLFHKLSAK